jgi:hypothetical protein
MGYGGPVMDRARMLQKMGLDVMDQYYDDLSAEQIDRL